MQKTFQGALSKLDGVKFKTLADLSAAVNAIKLVRIKV